MGRAFPSHCQSSDDDGVSTDTSISDKAPHRRHGSRRSRGSWSGSDSDGTCSSGGGIRKRMDFQVKSKSPNLEARRAILMMWPMPLGSGPTVSPTVVIIMRILNLMPLVVSSLTGDASDVFDWILSLNPGNTQDLTTLLQMLREHYCGSLTFREQRKYNRESPPGGLRRWP